ncbi:hypothetical protein EST92_19845 [Streptomyces sp. TM32]|uniref:hypothetical protein n=1 Tax=Streptomyces sp. TM32 TaxID=1652669 RepID=UPI0010107DFC|nr:hypothetical protein [Streptomyces sp. TM32]RXS78887.1 hypothetical protein EST92_19845 [Streptomyces sp. TM32]
MTRPSEAEATWHQQMVLRETLTLAVPLHMVELHGLSPDRLAGIASDAATTIGSHGDALQFGGKHCAEAFNALARGLAAAALTADGGADFAGHHWCADPRCRAASRFDHAPDTDDDAEPPKATPIPEPRATHDVPLTGTYL